MSAFGPCLEAASVSSVLGITMAGKYQQMEDNRLNTSRFVLTRKWRTSRRPETESNFHLLSLRSVSKSHFLFGKRFLFNSSFGSRFIVSVRTSLINMFYHCMVGLLILIASLLSAQRKAASAVLKSTFCRRRAFITRPTVSGVLSFIYTY